jgi:hypothetical protein
MKSNLEFEKSKKMTNIEFLSNMGGLFGLCLGFSMVSFVEVVYWLVLRGVLQCWRRVE